MTWGGLGTRLMNCVQQFKIDYMQDPLGEFENEFDGGHNTVFVEKGLDAEEDSLTSVTINVPLDTIMSFRLSAGITQNDEVVWIEGPIATFKSTKGNGCGDRDGHRRDGPESRDEWRPSFEERGSEDGISFSMDKNTSETVVVDWSKLDIINEDCLNGFAIEYRVMCRECDYRYIPREDTILVPRNQTKFDIPLLGANFIVSFYLLLPYRPQYSANC